MHSDTGNIFNKKLTKNLISIFWLELNHEKQLWFDFIPYVTLIRPAKNWVSIVIKNRELIIAFLKQHQNKNVNNK